MPAENYQRPIQVDGESGLPTPLIIPEHLFDYKSVHLLALSWLDPVVSKT